MPLSERTITEAIIKSYTEKLLDAISCDVAIVGAGPAGLVAAADLARGGWKTCLFERKLSIGGGMWGGGMMMNEIVVQDEGKELYAAVSQAARQRFRPIMMTSMAFSLGVTPLVLSSGAGAAGRNAIGSAVLGGTISATILGVLFVPLFYVLIRRVFPAKPPVGAAVEA